jgi:hypothetical protein
VALHRRRPATHARACAGRPGEQAVHRPLPTCTAPTAGTVTVQWGASARWSGRASSSSSWR